MALIASVIAYLATAAGISVGFLLIIGALLAPPAPTMRVHDAPTPSAQSRPAHHAVALSVHARNGGHPHVASFKHVAERKPSWLRAKSHAPIARERGDDWAYRRVPSMFSRRASYAQDLTGGFTFFR